MSDNQARRPVVDLVANDRSLIFLSYTCDSSLRYVMYNDVTKRRYVLPASDEVIEFFLEATCVAMNARRGFLVTGDRDGLVKTWQFALEDIKEEGGGEDAKGQGDEVLVLNEGNCSYKAIHAVTCVGFIDMVKEDKELPLRVISGHVGGSIFCGLLEGEVKILGSVSGKDISHLVVDGDLDKLRYAVVARSMVALTSDTVILMVLTERERDQYKFNPI